MKALAVVLKALLQQAGLKRARGRRAGLLLPPQPRHGPPPVPGTEAQTLLNASLASAVEGFRLSRQRASAPDVKVSYHAMKVHPQLFFSV